MSYFLNLSSTYQEWIVHGVLLFGILLFITSRFAGFYQIIVQPIAILLIVLGLFFEGSIFSTKEHRKQVEEYKEKVRLAEEQSQQVNTVIETKVIDKIMIVKEKTDANVQIIEKVVTKYDSMCILSNAAISLHNNASQNAISSSAGSTVEGTSNVKASELLTTVTENYGTYYQMREQLLGWQQWYLEQRKIYESVK